MTAPTTEQPLATGTATLALTAAVVSGALVAGLDHADRFRGHAMRGAKLGKHADIASTALAEGEIVTGDDAARADLAGEDVADEILCAGGGERRAETEHQHGVGARGSE